METTITNAAAATADVSPGDELSKGLEALYDGDSAAGAPPESSEDTASTTDKSPDRGQETAKGTKADDKSGPARTAVADTTKTNASPSTSATAKPSRSEQRIQELVKERDEWRSKAEMTAKAPVTAAPATVAANTDTPKEHVIVPPPDKPRYTMESLQNLKLKAKAEGNEELMEAIGEEMERVRMYDHDMKLWKLENGQAVERYQANVNHYRQYAVKNWPDLAKPDSPISVTYANVAQRFPELMNRGTGDGQYWLANVAHLIVAQKSHEGEKAALVEENKKLKEENETYKRKMSPAKQTDGTKTGSESDDDDPGKALTTALRERFGR